MTPSQNAVNIIATLVQRKFPDMPFFFEGTVITTTEDWMERFQEYFNSQEMLEDIIGFRIELEQRLERF